MISATFPANPSALINISSFVREYSENLPFSHKQVYEIDLAVDEAVSNIIDHSYKNLPRGDVRFKVSHTDEAMTIVLADDGKAVEFSKVPKPDLTSPLAERSERGLGVFLIHQMMDEVYYEPNYGEGNQLTMIKRFYNVPKQLPDDSKLPLETLRIISEINRSISSTLDLDKLLQKATDLIHQEFGYELVHIFLLDYVSQKIVFRAGSGSKAAFYEEHQVKYDIQAQPGLIPLAFRSGKTQLANITSDHPDYLQDYQYEGFVGSELCLPLEFHGQVMGVLDLQSDKTNSFTELDVEQLEVLSQSIAIAIRNANLYRTSQWHRNLVDRYRQTAEYLSEDASSKELLHFVFRQVPTILPIDFIGFWQRDLNNQTLSLKDYWARDVVISSLDFATNLKPMPWFGSLSGNQASIGKPAETTSDPIQTRLEMDPNFSAVASALNYQGRDYGVLTFHVNSAGRYGRDSLNICSTFADYIGNALDKERVEAEKETQTWLTSLLLDLAIETKNLNSIEELVNKIGNILIELIGGKAVGLALVSHDEDLVQLPSLYCPDLECNLAALPIFFAKQDVLTKGLHPDGLSVARIGDFPDLLTLLPELDSNGTILTFPLHTQDKTLGYLLHISSENYITEGPKEVIGKERYDILKGISQQAAMSLQNIQMLDEKREEYQAEIRLLELDNIFTQTYNFETGLKKVSQRLFTESNLQALALLKFNAENNNFTLLQLLEIDENQQIKFNETEKVYSEKEITDLVDLQSDMGDFTQGDNLFWKFNNERNEKNQLKTLVFPLEIGEDFYGLQLICDYEILLTPQRTGFFKAAADKISIAFQNERLRAVEQLRRQTDQELELARTIQKTFLPDHLPDIPGYKLAVEWKTARKVGGDFYDIFPVDDDKFGFLVADVSDKGLPASLYMTVARTLLRSQSRYNTSPAVVLEQVNHILQLDSTQAFYVTLVYAVLEPKSGKITYAIAGHNPPYVIDNASHKAIHLPKPNGSIAIGLLEAIKLEDRSLQLKEGQSFFLFTDGISEPMNEEGTEFGQSRLTEVLAENSDKNPEELIEKLLTELGNFKASGSLEDDCTILILKRL